MMDRPPVRSCCGLRHSGVQCPDGLVMCCICFERVAVSELTIDPDDGKPINVCNGCGSRVRVP